MNKLFLDNQGFTLLEVVVAIVIISTLAVAFAPLIASSVQRIHWAGQRTEVLYEQRGKMERLLASEAFQREQEITVTVGDFSRTIKGGIVQVDNFVTFLPYKEQ